MKRRPAPRAAAGPPKPPRAAAIDDADEFARAMSDVVRMARDDAERVRAKPGHVVSKARGSAAVPSRSSDPSLAEPAEQDAASFAAPGVSRRELRKLSRGEHEPGARLDVHGMTSVEAIGAVTRFIERGHGVHRCVAIVHGRGLHSEGGVAVLRSRVRAFLRAHPAVLAYTDAPRGEGGSGAVWVLLRR